MVGVNHRGKVNIERNQSRRESNRLRCVDYGQHKSIDKSIGLNLACMLFFVGEKVFESFRLHGSAVFIALFNEKIDQLLDRFVPFRGRALGFVRQSRSQVDHRGNAENLGVEKSPG